MKKMLCIVALSAFAVGGSLFAEGGFVAAGKGGKGGFQQTGDAGRLRTSLISEVKQAPDDTLVTVVGYIQEKLGDETYLFKEEQSLETIVVEIDDDKWRGLVVTPEDRVRLTGEVDKDDGKVKIDVKVVRRTDMQPSAKRGAASTAASSAAPSAAAAAACNCAAGSHGKKK